MKNIILAEPGLVPIVLLLFVVGIIIIGLFILGIVAILALLWSRRNKTSVPPASPPLPTSMQTIPPKCPKCGAPMPPDSPEGLCPRCLIAMNLATQTDIPGEPHAAKAPPPPAAPVADVAKLFPQLEIMECLG